MRSTSSLSSLRITYIIVGLLGFLTTQSYAEWKITNDTQKAILLVSNESTESEAVLIPIGQTKTFSLKPHKSFSKFYVKKRLDVYQEDQQNIFYKKYALVEREPSDDIKENTFTFSQIAQNDPAIKNRFVVHTFDLPTTTTQTK